jgi:uncharacterized protein (DUF1015 family)
MATVIPFKGILYNPSKVEPGSVMAPPYDIVTPDIKDELYSRSPFNIIRIDFGKDSDGDSEQENRYTRAGQFLSDWLEQDILIHDREPSFYCYEIAYTLGGLEKNTRGFLGAVQIEDPETGRVRPHEMTYSKPKSDRLNILRHCRANTSPIFSLYSSEEKRTSSILEDTVKNEPFIQAQNGEGFIHRLWRLSDANVLEAIQKELSDKDIFIADGHHRYETAFAYREEMDSRDPARPGDKPYHYVLMFLSNTEDEGLTLLPTHRLVEIDSDFNAKELLRKHFTVERIQSDALSGEQVRQKMFEKMRNKVHSFGMFLTNSNTYYTLSFNDNDMGIELPVYMKKLDVTVLHTYIFEKLLNVEHFEYEMDPDTAVERARKGSFEAVFFLNPTKIQDVKTVALAGQRMPPKSTFFYPKLLTGMVLNRF